MHSDIQELKADNRQVKQAALETLDTVNRIASTQERQFWIWTPDFHKENRGLCLLVKGVEGAKEALAEFACSEIIFAETSNQAVSFPTIQVERS